MDYNRESFFAKRNLALDIDLQNDSYALSLDASSDPHMAKTLSVNDHDHHVKNANTIVNHLDVAIDVNIPLKVCSAVYSMHVFIHVFIYPMFLSL